ncbi:MAG: hypothetical protein PF489_00700 [Salinivirgaceae bacterium]|jgi:hypothetical protein|nr:hypothetical protein [Salinivirgaceae bacterium]
MKQFLLLIFNSLSLIFALVLNGMQGSEMFNSVSVGEISRKYDTLIAPAGYAFAIWGVIYLMLILFVINQWVSWFRFKNDYELKQISLWFILGNLANGLWIVAWLNEYFALSVILIFTILLSLIMLTFRLRLEMWNAPFRVIFFVWWPLVIYLGWIVVASVANVAVWLVSMQWNGGVFSPEYWTIFMIGGATLIYLLLILTRNMREAALVGVWAFVAIAVKHFGKTDMLANAALVAAAILLIAISIHAYRNRKALPF